jgi:hypothetical protein
MSVQDLDKFKKDMKIKYSNLNSSNNIGGKAISPINRIK